MWKEQLPDKCPTDKAIDLESEVFRVTKSETPCGDDFLVYAKLYPENTRYQKVCKAYAISFFNTIENAKNAIKSSIERGNKLGNYIAKYNLVKEHGKSELNESNGHISTWFYDNANFESNNTLTIIEYNDN